MRALIAVAWASHVPRSRSKNPRVTLPPLVAAATTVPWNAEVEFFVFNDTIEGPRAPAVKPGRITKPDEGEREEERKRER